MNAMQYSTNVTLSEKAAAFIIIIIIIIVIIDYSPFYLEYTGRRFFQSACKYLRQQMASHLSVWY
jgi:hypothetical protein